MDLDKRVELTVREYIGIEIVRQKGSHNMFDRNGVAGVASAMGFAEAALFAASSPDYAKLIFAGPVVRDGQGNEIDLNTLADQVAKETPHGRVRVRQVVEIVDDDGEDGEDGEDEEG